MLRLAGPAPVLLPALTLLAGPARADVDYEFELADSTTNAAIFSTSLVLDEGGDPHVSYQDTGGTGLRYAWRESGTWSTAVADSTPSTGNESSLELDSQQQPRISYRHGPTRDLRYVERVAGDWVVQTVDGLGDTGRYTSLELDSGDEPHISYYDQTNGRLRYARRDGAGWHLATVDSSFATGSFTSLQLDSLDAPRISYFSAGANEIRYAEKLPAGWNVEVVTPVTFYTQFSTSLALDASGNPRIAYGALARVWYAERNAGVWTVTEIAQGEYPALVIDANGDPTISYSRVTTDVMWVAHRDGGAWAIDSVATGIEATGNCSTLNASGGVCLSFVNGLTFDLMYAEEQAGATGVAAARAPAGGGLTLGGPWPNPARPGDAALRLSITVPGAGPVELRMFDVRGRLVAAREAELFEGPGTRTVAWAPGRVPAGVYFVTGRTMAGATTSARWTVLR